MGAPARAYSWLTIHEQDGSTRDRNERDDMADEAECLDKAMKALEDAPDTPTVVKFYTEMEARRDYLWESLKGVRG